MSVSAIRRRAARPIRATRGDLLRPFGRAVLWLLVAVLLIRGLADVVQPPAPAPPARISQPVASSWPDDEARAFAAAFAREYLTVTANDATAHVEALTRFGTPDLAGTIAPELEPDARDQTVSSVVFAREVVVDRWRALLTFAVTGSAGTSYLTVPVARGADSGLVVEELPSFAAPPRVAHVTAEPDAPLSGPERGPLAAVAERFLRSYVAGDAGALDYLVSAGVRVAVPESRRYELVELVSLSEPERGSGRVREMAAVVRVRERRSRAVFTQRYLLRLERRERWYVADVNGTREG